MWGTCRRLRGKGCANCQSLPQAELFVRQRERPGEKLPERGTTPPEQDRAGHQPRREVKSNETCRRVSRSRSQTRSARPSVRSAPAPYVRAHVPRPSRKLSVARRRTLVAHGDLTSLAPHERLPEILVVPREKTPTGPDPSSKATLWVKAQHEGALPPPCIVRKDPRVPHTARRGA